jgi:hypothetical protein
VRALAACFLLAMVFALPAMADSHLMMPDISPNQRFFSGEPALLYYNLARKDPADVHGKLRIMVDVATGPVRTQALLYLARMEAAGIPHGVNLPESFRLFNEAAQQYLHYEQRMDWAKTQFTEWRSEAASGGERDSIDYIELAFYRDNLPPEEKIENNPVTRFLSTSLAKVAQPKRVKDFFGHDRQSLEKIGVRNLPPREQILMGVWRLADKGHHQAQYDIGLYYLSTEATDGVLLSDRLAKAREYLWKATESGHKAAASLLIKMLQDERSYSSIADACSIILAYRAQRSVLERRRIRFFNPSSECGTPEQPDLNNRELTQRLTRRLASTNIYFAEGNVYGSYRTVW